MEEKTFSIGLAKPVPNCDVGLNRRTRTRRA
jgi:hypothetical protein